jgi:hypothetical protein
MFAVTKRFFAALLRLIKEPQQAEQAKSYIASA